METHITEKNEIIIFADNVSRFDECRTPLIPNEEDIHDKFQERSRCWHANHKPNAEKIVR